MDVLPLQVVNEAEFAFVRLARRAGKLLNTHVTPATIESFLSTHSVASQEFGDFYSRQLVLSELGPTGQRRLSRSSALIVGLGGLGSSAALFLALAGVGRLRLVDLDTVELNNLHRQVLYDPTDLRLPKVEAAEKRLRTINSDVEVEALPENVTPQNVEDLVAGMDCIIDGLDNMRTRYLLNRAAIRKKIPYVFGGAIGLEGNLSVFQPPQTPCLECIMPGLSDDRMPTCDVRGVLGATTGIIGALQAMEAVKVLADIGHPLKARLLLFDFYQMKCLETEVRRREDCEACSTSHPVMPTSDDKPAWLCGHDTINVNPALEISLDLEEAERIVSRKHKVLLRSTTALVFTVNSHEVTLFSRGRILIKSTNDEQRALSIARGLIEEVKGAVRNH